jgi:hypothetical protein
MGAWLQSPRRGRDALGTAGKVPALLTSEAIGQLWLLLFLFTRVVPVIPNHLIYRGIVFEALVNKTVRVVRRLSLLQFVLGERMKSKSDGSVG